MNDLNIFSLIGLIIKAVAISMIAFYIVPKAFKQVLRPRDWLTGLRWQLLGMFSFSILASVPSIVYQIMRTNGMETEVLRNVASVSGNLSFLGISILLVMIYNYKEKE